MSLVAFSLLACVNRPPPPPPTEARSFRVLGINDVYRVNGFPESDAGGIPRVRALRAELEAQSPDLLVTGAGDFFYPSLLSRSYDGAQMVDALNHLDGDGEAFDERLALTFGNHEFDKDDCEDARVVRERIAESQFRWVSSNLGFQACEDQAAPGGENLLNTWLTELGGVKVGVLGVILPLESQPAYVGRYDDALESARTASAALRALGAEVVIAVTHQRLETDLSMLEALGEAGPDLVMGGHEHESHLEQAGGRWVLKADADARSAVVATLTLVDGSLEVSHELVALDADGPAPDAALQGVVDGWLARHQTEFCAKAGLEDGCLDEALGLTKTKLVAEEVEIRKYETTLGDWVLDQALGATAGLGAQAAFVNAGSLRLNQDIPAGAQVTRRHVETLFAFPAELVVLELSGETLQAVVDHAISDWTGNGRFLQVSGLRFTHDVEAGEARALSVMVDGEWALVEPTGTYAVTTSSYLAGGNDGYQMLAGAPQRSADAELKQLVIEGLEAAGEAGISPKLEGRICNTERSAGCPGG